MRNYRIGVVGGDGIGPEVANEGLKVLDVAAKKFGFTTELTHYPYCGQHYIDTGELVTDDVVEEWRGLDAIFLGAIGHPDLEPGFVERSVILSMRFRLDLYINLRPIKLYAEHLCPLKDKKPEDLDIMVIRENTEGLYSQAGGFIHKGTPDEVAVMEGIYTRKGCERAIRYAFEMARKRDKAKRVTLVDKANAVRPHDIWTRAFEEVGEEYPDIEQDHAYIDAACMWMIKNPEWFDVIVTTNMFGDILTDLGAMLQGGLGIAASGNIHPGQTSMFEPIHGSAPKYGGKNVASPVGAINAVGMMLDYLGETEAAQQVETTIESLLVSQRIPSLDARSGLKTDQVGDMVAKELDRQIVPN
jgi:3-isopropylmalate dehydrogenase